MSEKIPLIHPIYLDVPMLVSFAAATQGGLAFEAEITSEKKASDSTSGNISGKFGISKLFQSLFDASISVEASGNKSNELQELRKESKAYTEASIAIILYHQFKQNGSYIKQPQSIEDIEDLEIGMLVEVAGKVEKNAIDAVIDYIDAVDILSGMAAPAPQTQSKGKVTSQNKSSSSDIMRIREALDKDRKRTPLSNVVVRCSEPSNLNIVATLRTENLRDLTLSELHKNNVRIVGKITRVLSKNESMSSFENYGMSIVQPQVLNDLFLAISNSNEYVAEFSDVQIKGPAFQILPLMIFV